MRSIEGRLEAGGKSFAIVASRFNDFVVKQLIDGAAGALRSHGVADENILLVRVSGAFEIPPVAQRLALSGRFAAVVCLGVVVRGDTPHFDYVAGEAAAGIARAAMAGGAPVSFGVLTTETLEQAIDRAGGKAGNKGAEAALAAIEMASVQGAIDEWLAAQRPRP